MAEALASLLLSLTKLSKVDGALALISAERKKLETDLAAKLRSLRKQQDEESAFTKTVEEKRAKYQREEKFLKDERAKLGERRGALSSQTNYKLAQAADKEIDYGMRQLNLREEALISILEEFDKLDAELATMREALKSATTEYENFKENAEGTFVSLEERQQKFAAEREVIVREVDAASLVQYDRIRTRYPINPVVPLDETNSCTGCFMRLGPQVVVQVGRGDSLVKCAGCGRIVYK